LLNYSLLHSYSRPGRLPNRETLGLLQHIFTGQMLFLFLTNDAKATKE